MENIISERNFKRFNEEASKVRLQKMKADVEAMRLADQKSLNIKEVGLEKTALNERQ